MTQFELVTAAAFVALAAARVEVAVIEAGLGGRLDATNTIPSRVTVLTSVGLDHTEWLGETEEEIAAEKLAVLRDHSTLVLGRVEPGGRGAGRANRRRAGRAAGRRPGGSRARSVRLRAAGAFQRRNFALACAAAEAFLGELDLERGRARSRRRSRSRAGWSGSASDPPVFLDAAHNPDGAAALAEALPGVAAGRPRGRLPGDPRRQGRRRRWSQALAPALARAVCTELPADGPQAPNRGTSGPSAVGSRRRSSPACAAGGAAGGGRAGLRGRVRRARELAREPGGRPPRHRLALRAGARPRRSRRLTACARIDERWTRERRLRTALDDGTGRRGGRRGDPGLLRARLPVRQPLPLDAAA